MAKRARIEGVDVARGLASLIMIQGHAYDGWVNASGKETAAYAFTRVLGSLPLPAFLVLAGAAVVLRSDAAAPRGESARDVRRAVVRRGLWVVLYGYLTNLVYALMDGWTGPETFLRADVLHVIGLSIVALSLLGIRGADAPTRRSMWWGASLLTVLPTALSVWLSPLGAHLSGPVGALAALFVDVPGVTVMPFVPLASWVGLGALACLAVLTSSGAAEKVPLAGASDRFFLGLALVSIVLVAFGNTLMTTLLDLLGGSLSRAHPAVIGNVIDLGARGLLVLAGGALLTARLPVPARTLLVRVGRGSLVAYVFHIPFCYGRLGAPLRGQLDMATATVFVIALMALSVVAVLFRQRVARWRRQRG
ncbi:MAG: heparan-alpha-glucosaminide N-acetyltransferase domain-containing protein [Sandaracinaceae bacterium]